MNLLEKIMTAIRGAATETGEAIVDTQAIRILEQEMRDARKHLDSAKENLTAVMAEQMGIEREVKRLNKAISEHENYVGQALDKGDEALALEIANKIAQFTGDLDSQQGVLDNYTGQISHLKQVIKDTERSVQGMEREISVVKTTESVNRASEAAAAKFSGTNSSLRSATDSLERIKKRQQKRSDQMKAAQSMQREEQGSDLQDRLKSAGIVSSSASSNSILEQLKAKRAGAASPPASPASSSKPKSKS